MSRPSTAGLSEPWVRGAPDFGVSINPALVPSLLAVDSSWWCTHKQYGLGNYDENQKDTSNFGRLERAHELPSLAAHTVQIGKVHA